MRALISSKGENDDDAYLLNRLKMIFHAFNGDVFASFDRLGLKYLGKCSFSLFADKPVFLHYSDSD